MFSQYITGEDTRTQYPHRLQDSDLLAGANMRPHLVKWQTMIIGQMIWWKTCSEIDNQEILYPISYMKTQCYNIIFIFML